MNNQSWLTHIYPDVGPNLYTGHTHTVYRNSGKPKAGIIESDGYMNCGEIYRFRLGPLPN